MSNAGELSSKAAETKPSKTTATSNIRRKFSRLPKLQGQYNYQTWASTCRITFNAADWWEALSIENRTENDIELSKTEIKKARKEMNSLLISAVCENIQPTVVSAENAYNEWKALKDVQDRVSPNTTITLLSCTPRHEDSRIRFINRASRDLRCELEDSQVQTTKRKLQTR